MSLAAALGTLLMLWALPSVAAPECRDLIHREVRYTICEARADEDRIELFLRSPSGALIGQFRRAEAEAARDGAALAFAMNAGMYHPDRAPVGLYIEDGREVTPLITADGPGNFGLLPNGVFCLREGRADVIETRRFAAVAPACRAATQSGPMLVIDGALHPRFLPDGTSRFLRNGVGTSADGTRAVFAISNAPVTFHEFGTLYRDVLNLPNALYFDGNISRLYAPMIDRNDTGFPMGPIVGVLVPGD